MSLPWLSSIISDLGRMYVAKDFGTVRIVHDGSPFDVLYDVKVERLVAGEIKEVEKREAAFISLVESPDSISKFRLEREFLTNNFSLFEVSGDFVFQDIKLSTDADILSNFCFENVHHFDFVSNGIVLKHFPKDVVIVAMPYSEPHVRLYFKRDDIPASFKMSYDCLFVHTNKRQKLRYGVMTTHHKYSDGVIAELE